MPVLVQGRPLVQREPALVVENRLAAGRWRFRLVVVDDAGNASAPADLVVTVARDGSADPAPRGPTRPVLDVPPPVRPVAPPTPAPTPSPGPTPRNPTRRPPR
jgi:hypothetical protein